MIVTISNHTQQQFLQALLQTDKQNPYALTQNSNGISGQHSILIQMIQRFVEGRTSVLPFRNRNKVHWLVLCREKHHLIRHYQELRRVVTPYYIEQSLEKIVFFRPEKGGMGQLGHQLFPDGYLLFQSELQYESVIFQKLQLWLTLDEQRPEIPYQELEVSAFRLRNKFRQAVSVQDWNHAKEALQELKQGKFLSDENLQFLHIHLESAQGKWSEIWNSEIFHMLSELGSLPVRIRAILLQSYYQIVLLPYDYEGNYERALEEFRQTRGRLGTLLRSQLGLDEDLVLRVFAYEAASQGQSDKLTRYLEKATEDQTKHIIKYLLQYIKRTSEQPQMIAEVDVFQQIDEHVKEREYEDAYLKLLDLPVSIEKIKRLALIAVMEETLEICEVTSREFALLSDIERQQLMSNPSVKGTIYYALQFSKGKAIQPENVTTEERTMNWNQWFSNLLQGDYSAEQLEQDLTILERNVDNRRNITWSISVLRDLSDCLASVALETLDAVQKTLIEGALPMLISELLLDEGFPNVKAESVYEYGIEALLIHGRKNEQNISSLLRLVQGYLQLDMEKAEHLWERTKEWFQIPRERLSNSVLETLELFEEYGVPDQSLAELWNNWVSALIQRISSDKKTIIQSWLEIGKGISGDDQLVQLLQDKLAQTDDITDPIAQLGKMEITIFSLREKSALRAADRIKVRNPSLKIRICTSDRLTTEAKSYATSCDLAVIVTSCLSHALFYGISPLINRNPVYPRSAGETAIIEALEQYAADMNTNQKVS